MRVHGAGECKGWSPGPYAAAAMCRKCWRQQNAATRQGGPNAPPAIPAAGRPVTRVAATPPTAERPPCIHLGTLQAACPLGDPARDVHHCLCERTDWTRCWRSPLSNIDADVGSCQRCQHHDDGVPVPTSGVVIGSYNLPKLIALQVRLIRDHCGDVPILIVDDCSDGYGHTPGPETVCGQLRAIAATDVNTTLFVHPQRMGHASGDLSKVWTGLQWAKVRGLKVIACLSQRLMIDRKRWLQEGAKELVRSGLATASQPCKEGNSYFPIRSEAMLLDVDRWHTPAILDHLMPRKLTPIPGEWGVAAEYVFVDDIKDRLDGKFHPWSLFGHDRGTQYPGVVWHCSHGPEAYAAIARRYGMSLDSNFTTNGWRFIEGQKYWG